MTDLEKLLLALHKTETSHRKVFAHADTCEVLRTLYAELKLLVETPAVERLEDIPDPPWPAGAENGNNARRSGWTHFYQGRPRDQCPFPPARTDLLTAFQHGWDTAKDHAEDHAEDNSLKAMRMKAQPTRTEMYAAAPFMREALIAAADQFLAYAHLHDAKGTDDGKVKAQTNRAFARRCLEALP